MDMEPRKIIAASSCHQSSEIGDPLQSEPCARCAMNRQIGKQFVLNERRKRKGRSNLNLLPGRTSAYSRDKPGVVGEARMKFDMQAIVPMPDRFLASPMPGWKVGRIGWQTKPISKHR